MTKRKPILWICMLLIQFLLLLLALEAVLRVWYFFHNMREPPFAYVTEDLGWRPSADLSFTYARKHYGEINYSSTRDGFRSFGQLDTNLSKILVVGDSFTQAYHVSDGEPYFDRLGQLMGVEIFAIAAGGYGTIQQAMIIDEFSPEIAPDTIIWQFTGNDFINNDWLLESQSNENSSHMRRPFWEDGQVVYRHPDGMLGRVAQYSFLVRRALLIRGSFRKRSAGSIETQLNSEHDDLRRSIATTATVINNAMSRYPDVRFYAFFAGREHYPWELDAFDQVCKQSRIRCVKEVHKKLASAAENGDMVDGGHDGHWNKRGHELAAEVLAKTVQK